METEREKNKRDTRATHRQNRQTQREKGGRESIGEEDSVDQWTTLGKLYYGSMNWQIGF